MDETRFEFDDVKLLFQSNNLLGEGPLWDSRCGDLYWIDIRRCRISRFNLGQNCQTGVWITPTRPGCIALTSDESKLLVAAREEIFILNLNNGKLSKIASLQIDRKLFRANDGRVDSAGCLWVGTMIDDIYAPEHFKGGQVFRIDPEGNTSSTNYEFELPNGIAWNSESTLMYINDTTSLFTYCFDFDLENGQLSNKRIFFDHSKGSGYPDGLFVDAENCVWSAQWDGWNIRKLSPDGKLIKEFQMPVRRPSSATFFGPNMNQIAITSATVDFSTEDFLKSPNAGSLFSMQTKSTGVVENQFPLKNQSLSNLI